MWFFCYVVVQGLYMISHILLQARNDITPDRVWRLHSLRGKDSWQRDGTYIFEFSRLWGFIQYAFLPIKIIFYENRYFSFFIFDVIIFDFSNGIWLKITALHTRNKKGRDRENPINIKEVMTRFYNNCLKYWHIL